MEKIQEKESICKKIGEYVERQELKRLSFFSIKYIDRMDSC